MEVFKTCSRARRIYSQPSLAAQEICKCNCFKEYREFQLKTERTLKQLAKGIDVLNKKCKRLEKAINKYEEMLYAKNSLISDMKIELYKYKVAMNRARRNAKVALTQRDEAIMREKQAQARVQLLLDQIAEASPKLDQSKSICSFRDNTFPTDLMTNNCTVTLIDNSENLRSESDTCICRKNNNPRCMHVSISRISFQEIRLVDR